MADFVGRVFARAADGSIGTGIEGARLQFRGPQTESTTTDAGGIYRISLTAGRYEVVAEAAGFEPGHTRAVLRTDPQTLNLFLEEASAPRRVGIHGRVFARQPDGSIGDPVVGASVAATRRGFATTTVTDQEGRYSFELASGRYTVNARARAFESSSLLVAVRDRMHVVNLFLRVEGAVPVQTEPEVCDFADASDGPRRTSEVLLPGGDIAELTYQVVDGLAVLEGGIVLGTVAALDAEVAAARRNQADVDDVPASPGLTTIRQPLVALGSRDKLWESGLVPYQVEESSALLRRRVQEAMEHISANSNVEFVAASDRFEDRIVIRFSRDPNSSRADLGRQGGVQHIVLKPDFGVSGIVHEIMHGLGVFHEHTRNDRDQFVKVECDNVNCNIIEKYKLNFEKAMHRGGIDIGAYDYESVMHYRAKAFGKDDPASPGNKLTTLSPLMPGVSASDLGAARDAAPYLSAGDIAGLNRLYPAHLDYDGGHLWGAENYVTGVAMGDIDGDGRDELIVARKAPGNGRYYVLDDAARDFRLRITGGADWGNGNYATCCATGDVDGDGIHELIVGRKAPGNQRFLVSKVIPRRSRPWREDVLFPGGDDWGSGAHTTAVAIGVDAAGTPLIGVARHTDTNSRFFVFAGAADSFRLLFSGGSDWGSGHFATGIAFGDVDGDGRLELGVARKAGENARWLVLKDVAGDYTDFQTLHSGGVNWGSANYATGIAFGDVDGDGRDEVAVSRKAPGNGRYFVFGDAAENFRLLETGGESWGSEYYATAVALGDVDGDGRAELAVARFARENARVFLCDDEDENYRPLWDDGRRWGSGAYATAVALGNGIGPGRQRHIAVGRRSSVNHRFSVTDYNP